MKIGWFARVTKRRTIIGLDHLICRADEWDESIPCPHSEKVDPDCGRLGRGHFLFAVRFNDCHINRKYQEEISYKLAQLPNKLNSAEKEWNDFKDIIQGTAEKMVMLNKSVLNYFRHFLSS